MGAEVACRHLPALREAAEVPPTAETPTSVQLGVSNKTMLWRGFVQHCPVCGGGGLFTSWFTMVERCPTCELRFDRTAGHWIGYVGLNTIISFTLTFFVLMGATVLTLPEIPVVPVILVTLVPSAAFPLAFARGSRTTWTAIDLIMRPLEPGEVDPRFVVVDPDRDKGRGGAR